MKDVQFINTTHGWAVGAKIFVTTDSGLTWASQFNFPFEAISFVDAKHGWAAGSGGQIAATTTGGATWDWQTTGTTNVVRYLD